MTEMKPESPRANHRHHTHSGPILKKWQNSASVILLNVSGVWHFEAVKQAPAKQ